MIDLNTLIPPNSGLQLTVAFFVSDTGEIAGLGVPPGCSPQDVEVCGHAFVLTPCDENHPGLKGYDHSLVDASTAATAVNSGQLRKSRQPQSQGLPVQQAR